MTHDTCVSTDQCWCWSQVSLPTWRLLAVWICSESGSELLVSFRLPIGPVTCCMKSGQLFSVTWFKTSFLLNRLNYSFYPFLCFGFCPAWLEECKWAKSGCQVYQCLPQAKQELAVLKCFLCSQMLFVPRRNVLDLSVTVIFRFISLSHSDDCHMATNHLYVYI